MDLSDASEKSPVTLPGIDLGTFRLVAQSLNHYATPGPIFDHISLNFSSMKNVSDEMLFVFRGLWFSRK
jgi:hypothetical protein